jgi:hypothetical protein
MSEWRVFPTEDPHARSPAKKTLVTERADGAQVEDFQGWNHGRTPFSSDCARRDAFVIRVCSGDIVRETTI